jgi:hypothetical protein
VADLLRLGSDTHSSVMFGVFFGIGAFFFAVSDLPLESLDPRLTIGVRQVVRAKAPPLAFMSIFGTIVLDVMCSYAPLFPFKYYTVATQVPTSSIACTTQF